jgi:uncharacterized protein (DUF1800 family)
MSVQGFIAVARFGLGAKPGELDQASASPEAWLKAQITAPSLPPALSGQPSSAERARDMFELREQRREAKQDKADGVASDATKQGGKLRAAYLEEAAARTLAMIQSDQPFYERLVAFWSNHFTVSTQRQAVAGLVGSFEREAIRPRVFGRFEDMLLASTRHPAMLLYLDNAQSIGPNSMVGKRADKGLNENLAREILELHTLGVDGGYTQKDVTEFARILTGWSIGKGDEPGAGAYRFRERAHEPGAKTLLGRAYSEAGEDEGRQALHAIASHPATARHIATKLARHFIAEDPPPAAIDRLAKSFQASGGDLKAVTLALIASPEAWAEPLAKYKTPQELVVSAFRALAPAKSDGEGEKAFRSLVGLGQLPFNAPSPAGWPDTADQWIGSDALMKRIDWCSLIGDRAGARVQAAAMLERTIGPVASPETKQAIEHAPSPGVALALLLASPEFQRR